MAHEPLQILLAEDDDGHARLIERNLKRAGFINQIVRARDGQEALDLVRGAASSPITAHFLLLLDINMPRIDGVEVLRQLKSDAATREIPVVVLSAKGHALTKVEAELAGAVLFLPKPFSPNQLLSEAQRILGQGGGERKND